MSIVALYARASGFACEFIPDALKLEMNYYRENIMRHKCLYTILVSIFMTITLVNSAFAQDELDKRLARIVEEYMNTKNALVHARTDLSGPWAERLETTLATTPNDLFDEEDLPVWQALQGTMMDATGEIIESDEIDVHREALGKLSEELRNLIETFGNPLEELFVLSCGDFGDGDVIWLNDSDKVANPYHGPENLSCGEVIAQL